MPANEVLQGVALYSFLMCLWELAHDLPLAPDGTSEFFAWLYLSVTLVSLIMVAAIS